MGSPGGGSDLPSQPSQHRWGMGRNPPPPRNGKGLGYQPKIGEKSRLFIKKQIQNAHSLMFFENFSCEKQQNIQKMCNLLKTMRTRGIHSPARSARRKRFATLKPAKEGGGQDPPTTYVKTGELPNTSLGGGGV